MFDYVPKDLQTKLVDIFPLAEFFGNFVMLIQAEGF